MEAVGRAGKLRILHIADQNWVGTASTFVRIHREMGNDARLVTLAQCVSGFPEDICLHLPFIKGTPGDMRLKRIVRALHGGRPAVREERGLTYWSPRSGFESLLFAFRDRLWAPIISRAVREYGLLDYDIYFLESGIEFYRDARMLKALKRRGKRIVCYYLGTDLRTRGLIRAVDELSDLNLTCEFDHLSLYPGIHYSFMPFDVEAFEPARRGGGARLRICHAPRNRALKGSNRIIEVVKSLERDHPVELVLIEGRTHAEALAIKATCDLGIDQVGNYGGMGYGMNSLETLAMEIPTITEMTPEYEAFVPDHPFINATETTLGDVILSVLADPELRRRKGKEGRAWVKKRHGAREVVEDVYRLWRQLGWIDGEGRYIPAGSSEAGVAPVSRANTVPGDRIPA